MGTINRIPQLYGQSHQQEVVAKTTPKMKLLIKLIINVMVKPILFVSHRQNGICQSVVTIITKEASANSPTV